MLQQILHNFNHWTIFYISYDYRANVHEGVWLYNHRNTVSWQFVRNVPMLHEGVWLYNHRNTVSWQFVCNVPMLHYDVRLYIGAKFFFFRVAEFFLKNFRLWVFCNEACSAPLRGTLLAFVNNAITFIALGRSAQLWFLIITEMTGSSSPPPPSILPLHCNLPLNSDILWILKVLSLNPQLKPTAGEKFWRLKPFYSRIWHSLVKTHILWERSLIWHYLYQNTEYEPAAGEKFQMLKPLYSMIWHFLRQHT